MRLERFVITDRSWQIIEPLLPGTDRSRGVTAKDNRLFLEAVLWKVRLGGPWRDLPPGFGHWNSVFRRFRRWAKAGVFDRIFAAVTGDPDFEYVLVAGTIVRVYQKASGAKGDSKSGHRALKGRIDHEDHRPDGCARKSRPVPSPARPGRRSDRRGRPDRRAELWRFSG